MKRASTTAPKGRPMKRRRIAPTPEAKALRAMKTEVRVARRPAQNAELKKTYEDHQNSITTAGIMYTCVNNLIRGNQALNQYVGDSVLPTSVRVNYNITQGPLAGVGDGTNVVRIVLFQWMDASVPVLTGVLETGTVWSTHRWENRDNIRVLADRFVTLAQRGSATDSYDNHGEMIYVPSKKLMPIKFNNAGAPQKGGIYMLVVSDSGIAPYPFFTAQVAVTYTDA